MKPGFAPLGLAPLIMIGAVVSSGGSCAHEPSANCSGVIGFAPMRFWKKLESGTSSSALTLIASPAGSTAKKREIGRNTI
jgi:hypothetical protein